MRLRPFSKRSALCLALGLAMTVLVVNFSLPRRNLKLDNFEKIKPGMTKAEVESIMGETELYFASGVAGPFVLGWNIDATLFSDEYCLSATFDYKWNVTKDALLSGRTQPLSQGSPIVGLVRSRPT